MLNSTYVSKMKRLILIFSIFCTILSAQAATTAQSVLNDAAKRLTDSSGTTATFTILDADAGTITGNIAASSNKFTFSVNETTTVFDGTTQWTISHDVEEVSIYDPTPDEIQQINPLDIIRNWSKYYNAKLVNSPSGTQRVELTPKTADNAFVKIVITFNSSTMLPTTITMTMADGGSAHVEITNLKLNQKIPASRLTVKKADYPGYEFIDMR